MYLKIPISVKILQWGQSAGKTQTQNKLVFVESSETVRQSKKIQSELHGDV